MHKWGMLAVGLCFSGWLLSVLWGRAAAVLPQQQELPMQVEHTQMIIREVHHGDDASELVVENVGGIMIAQGEVTVEFGKESLCFPISWLRPDQKLLVSCQHDGGAPAGNPTGCSGWNLTMYPEITGAVTAESVADGLVFTNHTTQSIGNVEAYYHIWDPERGMYIGQAVFLHLTDLASKEQRYIQAPENAQVVCILLTA